MIGEDEEGGGDSTGDCDTDTVARRLGLDSDEVGGFMVRRGFTGGGGRVGEETDADESLTEASTFILFAG